MPKVTVHCLVKNEDVWLWFALRSVIDYVDQIFLWDTGSTDNTLKIINSFLPNPKIDFRRVSLSSPDSHTQLRARMLQQTRTPWFMILDGDEIWPWEALRAALSALQKNPASAALITPFFNCVGDVFHFQDPKYVHYHIGERNGGFTFRFIKNQPGLKICQPHGRQEYRLKDTALQQLPASVLPFISFPYLHTTHLHRSLLSDTTRTTLKRQLKYRYDLGHPFPENFAFPEVFYLPRPGFVPDPFLKRSLSYVGFSALYSLPRLLKSELINKPEGY